VRREGRESRGRAPKRHFSSENGRARPVAFCADDAMQNAAGPHAARLAAPPLHRLRAWFQALTELTQAWRLASDGRAVGPQQLLSVAGTVIELLPLVITVPAPEKQVPGPQALVIIWLSSPASHWAPSWDVRPHTEPPLEHSGRSASVVLHDL
jgi:hypothetical protein